MLYNHKFRLVPFAEQEQANNIAEMKTRMVDVLNSKDKNESEKVALYQDLLTRLNKYKEEINVIPTVNIANQPDVPTKPKATVKHNLLKKHRLRMKPVKQEVVDIEEAADEEEVEEVRNPQIRRSLSRKGRSKVIPPIPRVPIKPSIVRNRTVPTKPVFAFGKRVTPTVTRSGRVSAPPVRMSGAGGILKVRLWKVPSL